MIIGLGYKKYSGKDEVGRYLAKKLGSIRIASGDTVKDAARVIFGFTDEQLHGKLKDVVDPEWGFPPSHALQLLGTDVVRTIHPDIWRRSTKRRLEKVPPFLNAHVTDVRFPNEGELVHSRGGYVVEVFSPVELREARAVAAGADLAEFRKRYTHPSETSLDGYPFDGRVINDSTLAVLHQRVDALLEELAA